jgi:tetratricopeptide (TPR) repeat protein
MRGDYATARQQLQETVRLRESVFPSEHPNVLYAKFNLARAMRLDGDFAGARTLLDSLLEPMARVLGPTSAMMGDLHGQRAETCMKMGDLDCAIQSAKAGVAILTDKTPFVFRIITMTNLAEAHLARKEWQDAVAICDQMLAMGRERNVPPTTMHVAATYRVRSLIGARRFGEALASTDDMLAELGTDERTRDARLETATLRAEVLAASGDHAHAQHAFREVAAEVEPLDAAWAAEILEHLAKSLDASGDPASAAQARVRAQQLSPAAVPAPAPSK